VFAYLLNPLVVTIQGRTGWSRVPAAVSLYIILAALLFGILGVFVPILIGQARTLVLGFDRTLEQARVAMTQMPWLESLGIRSDPTSFANQFDQELRSLINALPQLIVHAVSGIVNAVLALVISFYLVIEVERIAVNLDRAVPEAYRDEWLRGKAEFNRIWSSFLRGELILALVIGITVTIALGLLGVRNALLLGVFAGVLEVVPTVGPVLAMIPAVLIAWLQGSTLWAIDHTLFAGLVVAAYFAIQQLENHLIVPKVIGASVDLPPVVIIIGALAGAHLAGILGIFLAAPLLATARVGGQFLLGKLIE
jgi:predicted PurR-regulated permease PerM